MKRSNNFVYCLAISFFFCSCIRMNKGQEEDFHWIQLSRVKKKDKDKEILTLFIDTVDIVKLKSLKKVRSFEYGHKYSKISIHAAIELLAQLDSVPHLIFRGIDSLPTNLTKVKKLKDLALIEANFEELPESIGQFENLKSLTIGYSYYGFSKFNIKKLPNSFSQLQNLEYFLLNSSSISTFPMVLCELRKLSYIDIRNTNIDSIPDCACNIRKIATYRDSLLERLPCAERFRPKRVEPELVIEPEPISNRKHRLRHFMARTYSNILNWWFLNVYLR